MVVGAVEPNYFRRLHIHKCPGGLPGDFFGKRIVEQHTSHFWLCWNPECPVVESEYRCGTYQDAINVERANREKNQFKPGRRSGINGRRVGGKIVYEND